MKTACQKVLDHVGDAIACGIVHLDKKEMLSLARNPQFSSEQEAASLTAVINLFRGTNAVKLSALVHDQFGKQEIKTADSAEIQIAFKKSFYFSKTIKNGEAAILLVTKETTNIGMAWVQLKSVISLVEPLIP